MYNICVICKHSCEWSFQTFLTAEIYNISHKGRKCYTDEWAEDSNIPAGLYALRRPSCLLGKIHVKSITTWKFLNVWQKSVPWLKIFQRTNDRFSSASQMQWFLRQKGAFILFKEHFLNSFETPNCETRISSNENKLNSSLDASILTNGEWETP